MAWLGLAWLGVDLHLLVLVLRAQLVELYGEDARLFLLQCLVEETGFKEQRAHTHHGNKDTQKVSCTIVRSFSYILRYSVVWFVLCARVLFCFLHLFIEPL